MVSFWLNAVMQSKHNENYNGGIQSGFERLTNSEMDQKGVDVRIYYSTFSAM